MRRGSNSSTTTLKGAGSNRDDFQSKRGEQTFNALGSVKKNRSDMRRKSVVGATGMRHPRKPEVSDTQVRNLKCCLGAKRGLVRGRPHIMSP